MTVTVDSEPVATADRTGVRRRRLWLALAAALLLAGATATTVVFWPVGGDSGLAMCRTMAKHGPDEATGDIKSAFRHSKYPDLRTAGAEFAAALNHAAPDAAAGPQAVIVQLEPAFIAEIQAFGVVRAACAAHGVEVPLT